MIETAVIVATGQAEHQHTLVTDRSRAMQPVLGKPLIVRMMDQIYRAGIRRFVLIAGVNDGSVAQHLHKSWKADAKLELLLQMPTDSLVSCLARATLMIGAPYLLAGYNNLVHESYLSVLLREQEVNPQQLLVTLAHKQVGRSVPEWFLDENSRFSHSPSSGILPDYAIAGTQFCDVVTQGNSLLRHALTLGDVLAGCVNELRLNFHTVETEWVMKVATDHDLWLLNQRLLQDSHDTHILSELPLSVKVTQPVRIDPQVVVGEHATIGPFVYLERGATVGYGAHVARTIVLARGSVGANMSIEKMLVTSRGNLAAE